MAFSDYSDSFDYRDKIILDYAKDLCEAISLKVIAFLRTRTKEMQSVDYGLNNLWEEICFQFQTEMSAIWDLYDDFIDDIVRDTISDLPDFALAALAYSINFEEYDDDYEYDIEEIISSIKSNYIYEQAANEYLEQIEAYINDQQVAAFEEDKEG